MNKILAAVLGGALISSSLLGAGPALAYVDEEAYRFGWQQGQNDPARTARGVASHHQSAPTKPVTWGSGTS